MGISDDRIQIMGRWHSDAFKKYVRIQNASLLIRRNMTKGGEDCTVKSKTPEALVPMMYN
jgi:hypothetical protein